MRSASRPEESESSAPTRRTADCLGSGPDDRRHELEELLLDELRVDLPKRVAAARHRARLRHRAVGDAHRAVVVPRAEAELAPRPVGHRRLLHPHGRDVQADRRLARLAVAFEDELLLADRELVAARAQQLARRLEHRAHQLRAHLRERREEREPLALDAALAQVVRAAHHVVSVEHLAELLPEPLAHAFASVASVASIGSIGSIGSTGAPLPQRPERLDDLSLGAWRFATLTA